MSRKRIVKTKSGRPIVSSNTKKKSSPSPSYSPRSFKTGGKLKKK